MIDSKARHRFWSKVNQAGPDDCWEWQASRNHSGYGSFGLGYTMRGAHRIAYAIANGGELPEGQLVRHKCDNPPCCNPAHLEIGTAKDNTNDMMERGRHGTLGKTHCKNGHERTAENSYIRKGGLECKICILQDQRKRRAKKKLENG